MNLPKYGREIIATIITLFVIALALMITASYLRGPSTEGPFVAKLHQLEQTGVTFTALSPVDVYGEENVAGIVLCPGTPEEQAANGLGIKASQLRLNGGSVPAKENILVLIDQSHKTTVEKIDRSQLDLCPMGQQQGFDPHGAMPLIKTGEGSWSLAVG